MREETADLGQLRLYRHAMVIAVAGNLVLAAAKGLAAWQSGSSAVLSDAINSLSDTLYTVFLVLGLWLSQRPADLSHPQGHSRFEPLVGMTIGLAMGFAGFQAARQAVDRILGDTVVVSGVWATLVLLGSVLVKLVMFFLVRGIGRKARSPAIRATARDNLVDTLGSTAALVGVWGSRLVHPLADPLAGALVALFIFRNAFEVLRENLGYLTGRAPDPTLIDAISTVAKQVPGVLDVHQIIADYVGPQLRVDVHVDVDGRMTLLEAHDISDQVLAAIEALDEVDLAFVHLEPVPRSGNGSEQAGSGSTPASRP